LSTDFSFSAYGKISETERFADYREFLYKKGAIETANGLTINEEIIKKESNKVFKVDYNMQIKKF